MLKKRWIQMLLILLVLGLLLLHFYVPRFITEIQNPIVKLVATKSKTSKKVSFKNKSYKGKKIIFPSVDESLISTYLTYSVQDEAKGTILLLHGIRASKEHFIPLSKRLADMGFNSVAIDSRAHGESGGQHCTFGVLEKKDIAKLLDYLAANENIDDHIGIWGQSLGGAIALQAMGSEPRIDFGVIESTFTDFQTITNDYVNYHAGFNIRLLTNYLVRRAGKIAGFDPNDARPLTYCKKITQPILIVHGTKDARIKIAYGKANFEVIPSVDKEFVAFEKGNHLNIWEVGGEAYFEKVIAFFDKNTSTQ